MRATRFLLQASRPNLTGFDPKKAAAATMRRTGDPWARYEAWRYTGPFTRVNRFKNLFPGFGIASVAFGVYLVVEHFFFPEHDHHEAGHHTHIS